MTCSQFSESIGELADGSLPASERPRVEVHLQACGDCRQLLEDLKALRAQARTFETLPLPDALWPRLAARLRDQGVTEQTADATTGGLRYWIAIAAVLVAAIALALLFVRTEQSGSLLQRTAHDDAARPADAAGNAPAVASVEGIEAELKLAEEHYERAIAGLQKVAAADGTLDPDVAETVERNLQVIDQAIAESRSALNVEPQSRPARESLFEALRRKIVLLQDTIALMNEMRKGNQAGAGEIVEGLDKS
jgi:hypothetical protein